MQIKLHFQLNICTFCAGIGLKYWNFVKPFYLQVWIAIFGSLISLILAAFYIETLKKKLMNDNSERPKPIGYYIQLFYGVPFAVAGPDERGVM